MVPASATQGVSPTNLRCIARMPFYVLVIPAAAGSFDSVAATLRAPSTTLRMTELCAAYALQLETPSVLRHFPACRPHFCILRTRLIQHGIGIVHVHKNFSRPP